MATVQQTTQLEFHQAMADFKTMFPAMDDDVIEAVLRSNQGAVDATIDQLLSMTTDNENDKIRHQLDVIDSEQEQQVGDVSVSPKQNQISQQQLSLNSTAATKQLSSFPSSSLSSPSTPKMSDDGSPRLKDNVSGSPVAIAGTGAASSTNTIPSSKDGAASNSVCVSSNDTSSNDSTPLRQKKGWIPPLLGPLPDDFLRVTPPTICSPSYVAGLNKPQTEGELEDERIALFLQNEEFMAELRWNKDFLLMLDKDSPPEERLSNFPQTRSTDDDAVFKERLKNMGKMSRKKFSQLARVFTGRNKKRSSAKQILNQGPAPSRDNLLLQEEDSDGT